MIKILLQAYDCYSEDNVFVITQELEEEAIFQGTLKRWDMMLHHLTIKPTLRKKRAVCIINIAT